MTGPYDDVLIPLMRQRRRLAAALQILTEDQWQAPSRCDGWSVREVVAHLAGINPLYQLSAVCGLGGQPTQAMGEFDPVSSPRDMVAAVADQSSTQILNDFIASNESFFAAVEGLGEAGWTALAESPVGHVPIRMVCMHALWDSWVHERDIALPLGQTPQVEADEVATSLRYVAALGPAFGLGAGHNYRGQFAVEASKPDITFVLTIDDAVHLRDDSMPERTPVLRGDAVDLVEALSSRQPLPASAPRQWRQLHNGLRQTWDLELDPRGV